MTLFDLLFIVVFLATVVVLLTALVHVLRRRPRRARKVLAVHGRFLGLYFAVLLLVSLAAPQRIVALGEDRCFDDWCLAVDSCATVSELGHGEHAAKADGVFYVVTLRISNQGRGRAQRASSAAVRLRDDLGGTYDVSPRGQLAFEAERGPMAPLTSLLAVGRSLTTVRVFDIPNTAHVAGLTIEHPVGFGPGRLVIGEESSLLHRPTLNRLQ